jgi:hypothetical protein
MIDIAHIAALMITSLKDYSRVGLIVIMILEVDTHARVIRKVLGMERIRRIG